MNSNSTQNLIGFLAKKSLFKTDNKPKQPNFSDANSVNDQFSRSITPKAKNQSKSQISQFNVFRDASQKQLLKKGVSTIQKSSSRALTSTVMKPSQENRFDKIKPNEIYFSHVKQNTKQQNPQTSNFFKSASGKNKNLFMGFNPNPQKTQTKTFQSLQFEADRCLEGMTERLQQEINNLSQKIEVFNARMFKMLNSELQSVKYKILSMVEEAFMQSEKSIRSYIKQHQSQFLKEAASVKAQLEKQYAKISQMSVKIKTNEWRKTAAQIIGSDLENHIETLIDKTKHIELRMPQNNQRETIDKLNDFSKVLKDITYIKSWLK